MDEVKTLRHQQQLQQWQLHADPAASVHMWQQAHPEWVFCYQPQRQAADQVFLLGLQSDQRRDWLLQYGRVLFMDATFGTNHCRVRLRDCRVCICVTDILRIRSVWVILVYMRHLQDS